MDFDWLANGALAIGGGDRLVKSIRNANTANHAFEIARKSGLALGNYVALQATETAKKVIEDSEISLNVLVFDREGSMIGTSDA